MTDPRRHTAWGPFCRTKIRPRSAGCPARTCPDRSCPGLIAADMCPRRHGQCGARSRIRTGTARRPARFKLTVSTFHHPGKGRPRRALLTPLREQHEPSPLQPPEQVNHCFMLSDFMGK
jgi:hypothetical protein